MLRQQGDRIVGTLEWPPNRTNDTNVGGLTVSCTATCRITDTDNTTTTTTYQNTVLDHIPVLEIDSTNKSVEFEMPVGAEYSSALWEYGAVWFEVAYTASLVVGGDTILVVPFEYQRVLREVKANREQPKVATHTYNTDSACCSPSSPPLTLTLRTPPLTRTDVVHCDLHVDNTDSPYLVKGHVSLVYRVAVSVVDGSGGEGEEGEGIVLEERLCERPWNCNPNSTSTLPISLHIPTGQNQVMTEYNGEKAPWPMRVLVDSDNGDREEYAEGGTFMVWAGLAVVGVAEGRSGVGCELLLT